MNDRRILFSIVDRMHARVTWLALKSGRWKCIVAGIDMPPGGGIGTTPLRALSEVLLLASSSRRRR